MTGGRLFAGIAKPLVAMIHLPPLPGAANYDGRPVSQMASAAVEQARLLESAGFDGVMLQNTHDRPSRVTVPPASIAAMAAIAALVREGCTCEIGVNVHKNDAEGAMAVAAACGATFVRIKVLVAAVLGPEGVIQGAAEKALETRRSLGHDLEIWADLYELTSWPVTGIPTPALADLVVRFGMADRLIVTRATVEQSAEVVSQSRQGTSAPVLIGGRTNPANVRRALDASDGLIVGACLHQRGETARPLDREAVRRFMSAARAASPAA
jgi:membrane complex biogenesis BtpA family protein